ncbi:hypothetical protein [Clostridium saudiense]|uniref:hypothetical protein n=1 Tax=Clostridium saudiense TaxID=1414720 RepID=UPI00267025FA|nr:hypothetical protein [Clostridium saudiense]
MKKYVDIFGQMTKSNFENLLRENNIEFEKSIDNYGLFIEDKKISIDNTWTIIGEAKFIYNNIMYKNNSDVENNKRINYDLYYVDNSESEAA